MKLIKLFVGVILLHSLTTEAQYANGFVDIASIDPSIQVEMRYFSDWNFIGRKSPGYEANKCFLTKEAAHALAKIQKKLVSQGYSLLVFDCYRPQRAVNDFISWTKNAQDSRMQKVFYIEEPKEFLVRRGYLARRSGHSRGSTVDLTVISKSESSSEQRAGLRFREENIDCRYQKNIAATGQLDMGTTYDCFSRRTNTANKDISQMAQKNRQLLRRAMDKGGFYNYPKEWWHYTMRGEPFPKTFFDFVIQ